jgi:hypothetical protein
VEAVVSRTGVLEVVVVVDAVVSRTGVWEVYGVVVELVSATGVELVDPPSTGTLDQSPQV